MFYCLPHIFTSLWKLDGKHFWKGFCEARTFYHWRGTQRRFMFDSLPTTGTTKVYQVGKHLWAFYFAYLAICMLQSASWKQQQDLMFPILLSQLVPLHFDSTRKWNPAILFKNQMLNTLWRGWTKYLSPSSLTKYVLISLSFCNSVWSNNKIETPEKQHIFWDIFTYCTARVSNIRCFRKMCGSILLVLSVVEEKSTNWAVITL